LILRRSKLRKHNLSRGSFPWAQTGRLQGRTCLIVKLQGRTCLIVGGTSGSGLATAGRFLVEGALVVVCGRSQKTVAEARAILEDVGRERVLVLAADASDPAQVEGLFQQVLAFFSGRLDILYHVAGISGRRFGDAALHECTLEGWDTVLDANARSLFLTNRAAVRQVLAQPLDEHGLRGTVLNMGSVLGWSPAPDFFGTIAYSASKRATRAMTLNTAARYARDRIRFNLIAPALIETPMAVRAVADPAICAYLATKQPLVTIRKRSQVLYFTGVTPRSRIVT
jgi:NAD(P)-dependent dehydrogenase (short-subunit alcohol dehydrogenase family)